MSAARIAALVLAAGRSSRMGGPNKLLARFDGIPLVRRSVETALGSRAFETIVVVGHQAEAVRAALEGCEVDLVENGTFAEGLSTSLRLGIARASQSADGVLVMLADQPALRVDHLDALIDAFRPEGRGSIVVASHGLARGNPVILSARFAGEIETLSGDRGARGLIEANEALVRTVEIGAAAMVDVDTPEAMSAAGGILAPPALQGRS